MKIKILVAVKRVHDYKSRITVKKDNSDVDLSNTRMDLNPFDAIALEEAIKLKEQGIADEITVATIGNKKAEEQIKTCLAMGADKAIHIITDEILQPLAISEILKNLVKTNSFDLILMGKQAIDSDFNCTGQMLAAKLDYPQATFISKIKINNYEAEITREVDNGLETIKLNLPAVITCDLRLNKPRRPTLPNIIKARQKIIDKINLSDLNLDLPIGLKIIKIEQPSNKRKKIIVNSTNELLNHIRINN